ncbi:uncharacterized protein LOC124159751 [Ischnura elegans]|uniref:uncharacterized protein LOC124159751 n=1 Tax=Ischnura elegans TaxID=197161 RepID=UPI001ED8B151|nr:uncharacterized protein LOC124159751 [Ischnura elegans]
MPMGGARNKNRLCTFEEFCKIKNSIVVISNSDNLCLARAICVGISKHSDNAKTFNAVRRGGVLQTERAESLCEEYGIDLANGGELEDIAAFQDRLTEYKITVFGDRKGKEVLYEGPSTPAPDGSARKHIDLIYGERHFNYISSLQGAFSCSYYCRNCRTGYSKQYKHKCASECSRCMISPACDTGSPTVDCDECKRNFYGVNCFVNHLQKRGNGKSACEVVKFCTLCQRVYNIIRTKGEHKCGEVYCHACKKRHQAGKNCYMSPVVKKKKKSGKFIFIFYDIECTQDTPLPGKPSHFLHTPNLLVCQKACEICIEEESMEMCTGCGKRQHIFNGSDPVHAFLNTIVALRKRGFNEIICIAHYGKGYDSHFIVKTMVEKMSWQPKLISSGAKLMSVEYEGVKFIDSLNFLPMSLTKLPSALGLDDSLAKGYFPHLFNTAINKDYEGPMPPASDYGTEGMTREELKKFQKWYEEKVAKNYIFKMAEELEKYCIQDVNILRMAGVKFRREFLSLNDTDPFREALTIASACMRVFRKKYLRNDEIAIIPPGGYRCGDRQSREAILWLLAEERKRNISIQHAANGREIKKWGKKVDGFYEEGNEIFEFHGCFFHGCPRCYHNRHEPILNNRAETMQSRFETTEKKMKFFTDRGCKVTQKWECEFRSEVDRDIELKTFLMSHPIFQSVPLNPRDAFYGGRTNAIKLYHKVNEGEGEEIRYIDICSLYPYVNKYKKYPVGHPIVYVGSECPPLEDVEGLVKCVVLPPRDLYLPVLPMKANGKLFFPLCRECALTENQDSCDHDEYERALKGTWVTNEVKKAVSLGYRILKMEEVWHYTTTEYSRETRGGGLFSGYIDNFLKIKQEASGWPSWCTCEEKKRKYLKEFHEREGIALDGDKIEFNAGRRSLSKLMLNSFWGKFGQRENLSRTGVIRKIDELYSLLTSPNTEVSRVIEVNDEVVYAHWEEVDEVISPAPSSNVVLANFTTAHARLELYSYLEKLDRRTLYHDTDSVIFTQRPGEWSPPVGDFLGDMTDEISPLGDRCYIAEFVSGGPKNYAYIVRSKSDAAFEKRVCKVRGITINVSNDNIVCFDTLKRMVLYEAPGRPITYKNRIYRTETHDVASRTEKKLFRMVYTKRKRVEEFETLPYGFKKRRTEKS